MLLTEREIQIPAWNGRGSVLNHFENAILNCLSVDELAVRFVVTHSGAGGYDCEFGVLSGFETGSYIPPARIDAGGDTIFSFSQRDVENTNAFNAVLIVPTGIGAEIGGHAGDATPAARLLAGACDRLITHPNVVNASDINEMPENSLYVEGSVLSRLFMGTVGLQPVRSNRVLLVIDEHEDERISDLSINAASAARATLGLECPGVIKLDPPIYMHAEYSASGRAAGEIKYIERVFDVISKRQGKFDALALASRVSVAEGLLHKYFQSDGHMINPWGGAEAMLTHTISMLFNIPSAHSPMVQDVDELNTLFGIVDPRMSAEAVSMCFLHCVLKGLHRSPRIVTDRMLFSHPDIITAADVSCLVIPDGCVGLPTLAAIEQGIPVIAVKENRNQMKNDLRKLPFAENKLFIVENYLEAAGVMAALKAGVAVSAVRRPIEDTAVFTERFESEIPVKTSRQKKAVPKTSKVEVVEK